MAVLSARLTPGNFLPEEGNILISAVALHFLPRVAYGIYLCCANAFGLALVLTECWVRIVWGVSRGFWSLGSLITVRMGYLGGTYLPDVLEHVGIAEPNVRPPPSSVVFD